MTQKTIQAMLEELREVFGKNFAAMVVCNDGVFSIEEAKQFTLPEIPEDPQEKLKS